MSFLLPKSLACRAARKEDKISLTAGRENGQTTDAVAVGIQLKVASVHGSLTRRVRRCQKKPKKRELEKNGKYERTHVVAEMCQLLLLCVSM